jgi:hypothetical protein
VLHAIDGISTEGALMGFMKNGAFLWASDYIQNVRQASGYLREVFRATRRVGVAPEQFAAQHVGLTPWSTVEALMHDEPAAGSSGRSGSAAARTGRVPAAWEVARGTQYIQPGMDYTPLP